MISIKFGSLFFLILYPFHSSGNVVFSSYEKISWCECTSVVFFCLDLKPAVTLVQVNGLEVVTLARSVTTALMGAFFLTLFTVIMNNFPSFFCFFIQLEVEVTDLSGKVIDGPVRLDISVIDQNDNKPMFKEGPYVGHVMEGSPTGKSMPIISLQAYWNEIWIQIRTILWIFNSHGSLMWWRALLTLNEDRYSLSIPCIVCW